MPVSKIPDIVPFGADQTVYLVVDSFGTRDTVYLEAEFERADLETAIGELLAGQFNNPVREIAAEIQSRCDIDGQPVPEHVRDFVSSHAGLSPQPTLRLA